MFCSKCGCEITNAKFCPNCGSQIATVYVSQQTSQTQSNKTNPTPRPKKKSSHPILKALGIGFFVLIILGSIGNYINSEDSLSKNQYTYSNTSSINEAVTTIEYKKVKLQKLLDDLDENAARAQKAYKNTFVEVSGYIDNIDASGSYITIESEKGGYFNDIQCFIETEEQLNYILTKNSGDYVTIKGEITDVGEILGYSLHIDNIK